MTIGLVCDRCDALSPIQVAACVSCGAPLGSVTREGASVERPPATPPATAADAPVDAPRTTASHATRARLVLVKGETLDGAAYQLAGDEHVAGRTDGDIRFPEDRLLSPRHANFFFREGALVVRDEGSRNGVYLRLRGPAVLEPDQPFLVGEQLLAIRSARAATGGGLPDAEGTWFYGSPRRPARMQVVQLLVGGFEGLVVRTAAQAVTLGREGNAVNFPDDPFISGRHAQVTALDDGRFQLEDLRSKNGTFLRVRGEARLEHGDHLFLGAQLLRVEVGGAAGRVASEAANG